MTRSHRRILAIGLLFSAALAPSSRAHAGPTDPIGPDEARAPSTRADVLPSGSATWTEIVERDARARVPAGLSAPEPRVMERPAIPSPEIPPGLFSPTRATRAGAGEEVAPAPGTPLSAEGPGAPAAPFAPGVGFVALPDDNTSIPPDTCGAAGPSHLVTALNTQVRIQTKTGATLSTVSLEGFFGAGGLAGNAFDPRVIFDRISGRWLVVTDANSRSVDSAIWLAVSRSSDPTGTWDFYSLRGDAAGTAWADFPGIATNSKWIVISNNMFSLVGDVFVGAKLWVIDKPSLLASGSSTVRIFDTGFDETNGFSGFTFQPAVTTDAAQAKLFLIDGPYSSGSTRLLRLSELSGTPSAPTWSPTSGSATGFPGLFVLPNGFSFDALDASQSGLPSTCSGGTNPGASCATSDDCSGGGKCRRIDVGDPRISSMPMLRGSRLWVTHSGWLPAGGPTNRTAVFWYELSTGSAASPVVQSGVIDGGSGVHLFYPSIAVNSSGDALVGFTRSDAGRFAEAVRAGRIASDPPGTMRPVEVSKPGEDAYFKTFSGSRNRWGDYSATVVDPVDDTTFWTIQEYAATSVGTGTNDDRWGTWWQQVFASGAPTSTPVPTATPGPTATGGGGTCTPSATRICLLARRFSATLRWNDGSGFRDALVAEPKTDASGLFYFYASDPANWEILVKMIDGCGTNGRYWTLVSASTGFGWQLDVRDERTGEVRTYEHPLDGQASGIADFSSFAACGA